MTSMPSRPCSTDAPPCLPQLLRAGPAGADGFPRLLRTGLGESLVLPCLRAGAPACPALLGHDRRGQPCRALATATTTDRPRDEQTEQARRCGSGADDRG